MRALASYRIVDNKIRVKTYYCEDIIATCRSWGGKYAGGEWVLPVSRLESVQTEIGGNSEDLVEVEVIGKQIEGHSQIRVGWHVLAGRSSRDRRADIYGDLVSGEIPASGGSVKNPAVQASPDAAFRLWVPREFAVARGLTIVTDPANTVPFAPEAIAGKIVGHLAGLTDEQRKQVLVLVGAAD